jgi:hypothetical protein
LGGSAHGAVSISVSAETTAAEDCGNSLSPPNATSLLYKRNALNVDLEERRFSSDFNN